MTGNRNNSRLFSCVILIFFAALLMTGCESKPKYTEEELAQMPFATRTGLPEPSGGFVLTVVGETVTAEEIVRPLVEPARPFARAGDFQTFKAQAQSQLERLVTQRISNILLYSEAKKQAGEQIDDRLEKAADAEIKKFITSYGGDYARAEDALKQMQMDWKSFKEQQKKIIMSQSYIASKVNQEEKPITYSQLLENYEKIKDAVFAKKPMIKFSLIDIQPARIEVTDPNTTALDIARDTAAEVMRRLSENADFAELAKQYSHGYRSMAGGLWNAVNPESLAEPYDILAREAMKIQPGQIAGPIETANHIFIMKLEEKQNQGYEPFEKVQKQVRANIVFERQRQAVEEVSSQLVSQAAIAAKDEFVLYCLQKLYTLAGQ